MALTRAERLAKLSHAIWEYRGRYNVHAKKWVQTPKPKAIARVRRWLESLGVVDIEVAIKRIDGFKTHEAYHAFLKEVHDVNA